jgi:hypothetical protein
MKRVAGLIAILSLGACDAYFATEQVNPDAAPIEGPIVFTTSKQYRGAFLSGVEGADALCAEHASAAGLSGEFKAWLSQLGTSAADRLTHSTRAYFLVDGTRVAASWDDLIRTDLLHAIDLDEHGVRLTPELGADVWTATMVDGREVPWEPGGTPTQNPRLDCALWSTLDEGVGLLGLWNATNYFWTATSSGKFCGESARLYCFQQ